MKGDVRQQRESLEDEREASTAAGKFRVTLAKKKTTIKQIPINNGKEQRK